jgi:hypothetical protein
MGTKHVFVTVCGIDGKQHPAVAEVLQKGLSCHGLLTSAGCIKQVGPAEGPTKIHVHVLRDSRAKVGPAHGSPFANLICCSFGHGLAGLKSTCCHSLLSLHVSSCPPAASTKAGPASHWLAAGCDAEEEERQVQQQEGAPQETQDEAGHAKETTEEEILHGPVNQVIQGEDEEIVQPTETLDDILSGMD